MHCLTTIMENLSIPRSCSYSRNYLSILNNCSDLTPSRHLPFISVFFMAVFFSSHIFTLNFPLSSFTIFPQCGIDKNYIFFYWKIHLFLLMIIQKEPEVKKLNLKTLLYSSHTVTLYIAKYVLITPKLN